MTQDHREDRVVGLSDGPAPSRGIRGRFGPERPNLRIKFPEADCSIHRDPSRLLYRQPPPASLGASRRVEPSGRLFSSIVVCGFRTTSP